MRTRASIFALAASPVERNAWRFRRTPVARGRGIILPLSHSYLFLACLPLLGVPTSAAAESPAASSSEFECRLTVRLVAPTRAEEVGLRGLQMSSFVADADEQLKSLPYSDYRPLTMQEAVVKKGKTARFTLAPNDLPRYALKVSPKQIEGEKVCLRVDWQDEQGRQIVATRLKVANGENVVLGSDKVAGGPVVILVKPRCR